jgi:hypothetical protein
LMVPQPAPSRSRSSGIRAENFGDVSFGDHAEVKTKHGQLVVLLILGGATNLLWGKATKDMSELESLEAFRGWTDTMRCVPKVIVGDMAFFTPTFMTFHKTHGIRTLPTGPRTPWPNRAEGAVRLFKRQLLLLIKSVNDNPMLTGVHYFRLVKICVWARNNQFTMSGMTPLELAFCQDLLLYWTLKESILRN